MDKNKKVVVELVDMKYFLVLGKNYYDLGNVLIFGVNNYKIVVEIDKGDIFLEFNLVE